MCWNCAGKYRNALTESHFANDVAAAMHFDSAGASKATTAFIPDGIGDDKPNPADPVLITTDTIPGDIAGAQTLTINAPSFVSTIDTVGDKDFFKVTLTAGQKYEIGMYGKAAGPSNVVLADSYIELLDANGNLITTADGGADTPLNEFNSGFDVLLSFTPEASGVYYINARAFDNAPQDGTDGDAVGDYEIFVRDALPGSYEPYYDLDSPLHAIDWGTQINKINTSARNPDGQEGPRPTGDPQGTPTGPNLVAGKNVVTLYFAKAGELYVDSDPTTPGSTDTIVAKGIEAFEVESFINALAAYSRVADVVYQIVDNVYNALTQRAAADLTIVTYNGTPGTGLLGRHSPPDEDSEGQGEYNALGPGWNAIGLAPGGFSFVTILHELGHAHGLAHPHDNGGRSSIMRGVVAEGTAFDYTTGDFDLNQAIHTVMSYEDGWPKSPYGNARTTAGFGYQTGLSAFDIAVIQDKYGVNEETATGNNTYTLADANAQATFDAAGKLVTRATGYETIWDGGGIDEIVYGGARNTTIDLRAATLQYEVGGGGRVSFADAIGADKVFAGYTIANGVTIENGTTGSGNDTLIGNSADNVLNGNGGDDMFRLEVGGNDTANGGSGNDGFYFGKAFTSADIVDGGGGADQVALQGNYTLALGSLTNLTNVETLALLSGSDTRFGDTAGATYNYVITAANGNVGSGQILTINSNGLLAGESLTFNGSAETDGIFTVFAGLGVDNLTGGANNDGFFFGEGGRFAATDRVNGGGGADDQVGLRGDYSALVTLASTTLTNVDTIALISGTDFRYAPLGYDAKYNLKLDDANLAAGTLTVNGNSLAAGEWMRIDGSAETNGILRLIGGSGNDALIGGALADTIFGGQGADIQTGGGGNDTFLLLSYIESSSSSKDQITDFAVGDKIDLSAFDANITGGGDNDAFSFIGAAAFTGNSAGQLRAFGTGANWTIEADVDGNGIADLVIDITLAGGKIDIVTADFNL